MVNGLIIRMLLFYLVDFCLLFFLCEPSHAQKN